MSKVTSMIYEGYQQWDEPRHGMSAGKRRYVCTAYTREEAQRELDEFAESQRARGYGADHYWVEEVEPSTDFVTPEAPTVRDLYRVDWAKETTPGENHWNYQRGQIVRLGEIDDVVYEFTRNYPAHKPVEIFRQGERHFALIAPDYTATTVVDLDRGKVIATEQPAGGGFCPVGFYVPDWWDVHDGSMIPGSHFWDESDEVPDGSFGFVWGCIWGDDTSWKVQHLDLSRVAEGEIARDERFGYVELATIGDDPKEFIGIDTETNTVRFAVEKHYRLNGEEV